ncbi:MAG: YtxH domain-containing protein [Nitrospirota bacterium]
MERTEKSLAMVAVFSFLLGGAVGAGLALLMAPQSGKKTRRQIKDLAEDIAEHATEYAERLKKRVI